MGDVHDSAEHARAPLRPDRCPECGYLFYQPAREGACSECGWRWDSETIVLYGTGSGLWENMIDLSSCRDQVMGLLVIGLTFGAFVTALIAGYGEWISIALLIGCGIAVFLYFYRWGQAGQDTLTPHQLRLTREGFAQRSGIGRVRVRPWTRRTRVYIRQKGIMYHCCIYSGTSGAEKRFTLSLRIADIELLLTAEAIEALRQRLLAWDVLALPQKAETFWQQYDNDREAERQYQGGGS